MTDSPAIDDVVEAFERDWSAQGTPSIHRYLNRFTHDDPTQREALLVELICVDMEFRWKASSLAK